MVLKIFNTLGRKKQEFKPINEKKVRMYSCGPTVNGLPHLGHARTFISFDIIRRHIMFSGYNLLFVSNITDIDDKIIEKAKEEKITIKQLTKKYEKAHKEAYEKLNILPPDIQPHATEFIKEMINLVEILEKKGYTYKLEDGIYYDISRFKEYGKLSGQKIEDLEAGKRIKNETKKNPGDFVLWKFAKPNEPKWESPWGEGRPGWHLECSAMTWKLLGVPFDIHGGGSDLIFPHHEDEIAQTEAAFEKPMANYWIHTGMVNINKVKMSKSLGNFKTLEELFKKYDPLIIRYLTLTTHYRKPLDFSEEALEEAKNSYNRLKRIISELKEEQETNEKYLKQFKQAMDDDFNTPKALAALWELLRDKNAKGKKPTIKEIEKVFALDLFKEEKTNIPEEIIKIAEERLESRKNKNWEKSDQLRDLLKQKGWKINDTKENYKLERIK